MSDEHDGVQTSGSWRYEFGGHAGKGSVVLSRGKSGLLVLLRTDLTDFSHRSFAAGGVGKSALTIQLIQNQ